MERYKRIVICVDDPPADAKMLAYAGGRSRLAKSAEIHVLHVTPQPPPATEEPQAAGLPPSPVTSDTLRALVDEHFKGHGGEQVLCEVIQGPPLLEILRYAHDKDVDLIMLSRHLGRHGEADTEALLARRITRKATCSVLVLPEKYALQANALVVPVRDSECSANALEVACDVAATTGASVIALNVYRITSGYSRVGTDLEEHRARLEAAAGRECSRLLKRVDTHGMKVQCRCVADLHGASVRVILGELGDGTGKAVVIGARGRSGVAGVLLGNVTEQLIRQSPTPVLAVKKKGECLGIVRALLTIAGQG